MTAIADNLRSIRERIARAAEGAGRSPSEVTLLAVSKFHPPAAVEQAAAAGQLEFGENYPQELCAKAEAVCLPSIRWHLIGHLQRNKVERALRHADLIHSVDSLRLLEALEAASRRRAASAHVLLEVNASREPNKTGFALEEVPELGERLRSLPHVRVEGLMAMASYTADPGSARATFAEVRELRDRLRREWGEAFPLPHLSMGMSNDYEVAIEEGATIVRVGTAIFGPRD